MSRWLQSAKLAESSNKPAMAQDIEKPISSMGQRDNWDRTDKTPKAEQNSANPISESSVSSVVSVLSRVPSVNAEPLPSASDEGHSSPYGQTVGGRQLTWTGKVVSLDDWRKLSEWGRHGPGAGVWSGKSQQWEPAP